MHLFSHKSFAFMVLQSSLLLSLLVTRNLKNQVGLLCLLDAPRGFPGTSVVKNLPDIAGDSIFGLERSPGRGNGNPLQYSCLENPMDREAWWAIIHRVAKSQMGLNDKTTTMHIDFYSSLLLTWRWGGASV